MKKTNVIQLISVYLRLSIGVVYLWEVADRLGVLGANGQPHVGWGDWGHFLSYSGKVMSFLPGWRPLAAEYYAYASPFPWPFRLG